MIIYLDTSSLFKLYHYEDGTDELDKLFAENNISEILLSEISKIEFTSTVWKKIRMRDLDEERGTKLLHLFREDRDKYTFIEVSNEIIKLSVELIKKYGSFGLRTLDSIQLATAQKYKDKINYGKTSDKILGELLSKIGVVS